MDSDPEMAMRKCSTGTKLATLALAAMTLPAAAGFRPDGRAELLLPHVLSTAYSEVRLAVSPDGNTILWGSIDRPGGPGGWDIWMARRDGDDWTEPRPVSFDTPSHEFDPAFDAKGRYVYFFSDRPDGFGGDDIYRASFNAKQGSFGKAENLGDAINTEGNEWAPSPSPDGSRLMFATNGYDGYDGAGRHDIYVSMLRKGVWQPAEPLPGGVNTEDDEFDATYVNGGIVFARSIDVDEEPIALWYAARTAQGVFGKPVKLDDRINVDEGWVLGPSTSSSWPGVLFFSAQRPEVNRGKLDIYFIRFHFTPGR
jgi:hypothetical protein